MITLFLVILLLSNYSLNHSYSNNYKILTSINKIVLYNNPIKFDNNIINDGSIVEYYTAKGLKRLAYVNKRSGAHLEVTNEVKKTFSIPLSKITYHLHNNYTFDDLLNLVNDVDYIKQESLIKVYDFLQFQGINQCNIFDISHLLYQSNDTINIYLSLKLMQLYGSIFFTINDIINDVKPYKYSYITISHQYPNDLSAITYHLQSKTNVSNNLKMISTINQIKHKINSLMKSSTIYSSNHTYYPIHNINNNSTSNNISQSLNLFDEYLIGNSNSMLVNQLNNYINGLKYLSVKNHPWILNNWSRIKVNDSIVNEGIKFCELVGVSPNSKNARKILELCNIWSSYENIEKFIMNIRDSFDENTINESNELLDNYENITDPDERIRVDLRHLRSYAIDNEGALEIDDAISYEQLPSGQDKIWIHIADVSRWIRPGSYLSLEAEKRMTSIYMPDEKISMFPDKLSVELLSIGAKPTSFALSCGVTMNQLGEITSYEVCPSLINLTKKITYQQLDSILYNSNDIKIDKLIDEIISKYQSIDNIIDKEIEIIKYLNENNLLTNGTIDVNKYIEDLIIMKDLRILNRYALLRHDYRQKRGALDEYLKDKADLSLYAKRFEINRSIKYNVIGVCTWNNVSSINLVSEYMSLMCETIGGLCQAIHVPVWYKTQVPQPMLTYQDLQLQPNETPFLRTNRLLHHLKTANDSKIPMIHCTSGSLAYVQCTSPIRRYHDLYNHYRLKVALHGASLRQEWAYTAKEEAGICKLDQMSTAEERLSTLKAIKLVKRAREQYWYQIYIDKQIAISPKIVYDSVIINYNCLLSEYNPIKSISIPNLEDASTIPMDQSGHIYDVIIPQLGQYGKLHLYIPLKYMDKWDLKPGTILPCHIYKAYFNPIVYLCLPMEVNHLLDTLPIELMKALHIPTYNR